MQIIYTTEFSRRFKKFSKEAKLQAVEKEKIFRKNPHDSKLKLNKLSGKLKDCWAFSISYSDRIIIEFGDNDIVYFQTIGDHDLYK